MFKKALIRLTVTYSFLFFILFWAFSTGFYLYLQRSFGEGYITQVKERIMRDNDDLRVVERSDMVVTKATEVTLEHIRDGLILINGILFFLIPVTSWFLASRTLWPINRSHEQQKQFVSDASHELRTPLSILLGEIDLALKRNRQPDYYIKTLKSAKQSVNHLTGLVTNLLNLSNDEDRKNVISTEDIDLVDLLSGAVVGFNGQFKARRIKYVFNYPQESFVVRGNQPMLEELFTNLIDNAIKYSRPRSRITISVRKENDQAVVDVADQGIGIPKQYQNLIFDRFYRVDQSRSRTKGYGLGLAIVKHIIDKHQGKIKLKSTPGRGSIFTVYLPIFS